MENSEKIKPEKIILTVLIIVGIFILGKNIYTAVKHDTNNFTTPLTEGGTIFLTEEEMTEKVRGYYPEVVLMRRDEYDPTIHKEPTELNAVDAEDIRYVYFFNNKGIEFNVYEGTPFWAYGSNKVDSFICSCDYEEKLGEYVMNHMPDDLSEKLDSGVIERRRRCEFSYFIGSSRELHDAVTAYQELFECMKPFLPDDPGTDLSMLDVFAEFYTAWSEPGTKNNRMYVSFALIDCTCDKQIDWEQCESEVYDTYIIHVSRGWANDPYLTREDAERIMDDRDI